MVGLFVHSQQSLHARQTTGHSPQSNKQVVLNRFTHNFLKQGRAKGKKRVILLPNRRRRKKMGKVRYGKNSTGGKQGLNEISGSTLVITASLDWETWLTGNARHDTATKLQKRPLHSSLFSNGSLWPDLNHECPVEENERLVSLLGAALKLVEEADVCYVGVNSDGKPSQ